MLNSAYPRQGIISEYEKNILVRHRCCCCEVHFSTRVCFFNILWDCVINRKESKLKPSVMGSFKANIHNQSFLEQKYFQFSTISQILGPTVKICAANASREFCCLYFKPHPWICAECVPALRDLCRRPFEPAEGSSNHKSCFFLRLER